MKASVKPKNNLDFDKIIKSVKDMFGVELIHEKGKGLIYPKELNGEQVSEIQKFIRETF